MAAGIGFVSLRIRWLKALHYARAKSRREAAYLVARLSSHIHTHAQARPVSMPLMGAGQSGVDAPQRLLKNMFITMSLNRKLTLPAGLKIVLHESVRDKVDLTKIKLELEYTGS